MTRSSTSPTTTPPAPHDASPTTPPTTPPAPTPTTRFDPYAAGPPTSALRYLYRLNPLAKLAAVLPAIMVLAFTRDLATPAAFLALAYALLLTGARFTARLALLLGVVLPTATLALGLGFALWTDPARVDHTVALWRIGDWTLYGGALAVGMATALRLAALVALSLAAGLTTTGPDLVRALGQQLRMPYRIGATALAAFRFVPRFGRELELIRAAHRVRGVHRGGVLTAPARWAGYIVPLLAGAIRHAERVALAMDARAFGAYPTRTERHPVPWRARDTVFVALLWAATTALCVLWFPWGLR